VQHDDAIRRIVKRRLRPGKHRFLLGEQDHLALATQNVKCLQDSQPALRVTVHCHVVQEERADLLDRNEMLRHCHPKQEVYLLSCSVRQQPRVPPAAIGSADLYIESAGINLHIDVAIGRDRDEPATNAVGKHRGNVSMYALLGPLQEQSRFRRGLDPAAVGARVRQLLG
jgi:hypothetical protein